MQKKIKLIIIAAGIILLMQGCSHSLLPAAYRQRITALPTQISGSWADVKIKPGESITSEIMVSGELIAIQADTLFILSEYRLEGIGTKRISEVILHLYEKNTRVYVVITGLIYVPDIIAAIAYGMPEFLIIGLPGLVGGAIVTASEGTKSNLMKYPKEYNLADMKKFARYPQGMPPGIDKSKLHLVSAK